MRKSANQFSEKMMLSNKLITRSNTRCGKFRSATINDTWRYIGTHPAKAPARLFLAEG